MKDLYAENYKILMIKLKAHRHTKKDIILFIDWKNSC